MRWLDGITDSMDVSPSELSSKGDAGRPGREGAVAQGGWAGPLRGCRPGLRLMDCKSTRSEWLWSRDTTRGLAEPLPAPHPAVDHGLPEEGRSICPALDLDASCSPADR